MYMPTIFDTVSLDYLIILDFNMLSFQHEKQGTKLFLDTLNLKHFGQTIIILCC